MDLDGPFEEFKHRIGTLPTYFKTGPKEHGDHD